MINEYSSENVRNIVILGHAGTGKSTLLDALLFAGGKINQIGSSENSTLVSDYDIEEKKKKMSVHTAMGYIEVDGMKINIIDCPGHTDLVGERRAASQVVEGAILVIDSVAGVQVGTEKAWQYLVENNVPRIIFVNKMDQERASYDNVIENMTNNLHAHLVVAAIPLGAESNFQGVIDVLDMKAKKPKSPGSNETIECDVDPSMIAQVKEQRSKTVEIAAEGDDELIEMFLEGKEFDEQLILRGIKEQMMANKLHPVICGAAQKNIGVKTLLKLIKQFMPSPVETGDIPAFDLNKNGDDVLLKVSSKGKAAAVVWKTYIDQYAGKFSFVKVISGCLTPDRELINTDVNEKEKISKVYTMLGKDFHEVPKLHAGDIGVLLKLDRTATRHTLCDPSAPYKIPIIKLPHPVFGYAIRAANKNEDDKLGQILTKYEEQYPTLHYSFNPETKQSVIHGMGKLHLDLTLDEIKEKYKIEFVTSTPRISYRETISKQAEAQYKHKKQSGGHGQYGEVYMRIYPLPRGTGFEFTEKIVGGAIPKNFFPAVEKGVNEALVEGVVAKYPVVDVKAELFDGSFHAVDSSEMSFKIAALHCFKKAMEMAGPQILEPIMSTKIFVDKQFLGDVMGDITKRRGKVLGTESKDETSMEGISIVKALIPHAEMLNYSIDIQALTQNKAVFEMEFSHYEPISGRIADKVIEDRIKMLEE